MDLLNSCSLDEKRLLLKHLQEDVGSNDGIQQCSTSSTDNLESEHFSFQKFISYHPSFIEDASLQDDLFAELDTLDLYRPNSKKVQSVWLSAGKSTLPNSIDKYPNITRLLDLVNKHESIPKGSLDCCNVVCYRNDSKTLRLHSDNESNIDQTHPICTFSIGAPRCIEFVPYDSNYTRVVCSVTADSNSIYTMHPGCQSLLQHRVLPGCSSKSSNQVRYSVSFRKYKPELVPNHCGDTTSINEVPSTTTVPATLIIGDSFPARLNKDGLGKNKKVVINIAKGGSRIPDVIQSIKDFKNNAENAKYAINQEFISVGTNDIRNCNRKGVFHLKSELFGLIHSVKNSFSNSKIYMQSLIPLPVTSINHDYTIKNVLEFNKLIYHVCTHERVFLLDVFRRFLFERHRNPRLFNRSITDIHPNARGLGVLERAYIDRIHGGYFDPHSPN